MKKHFSRPPHSRKSAASPAAAASSPVVAGERLHKVLARAGLGSRRLMEKWISAGRVTVNGQPAGLGSSISPGDEVRVDGRPVAAGRLFERIVRVIGYHKPAGLVCTRQDEQGRSTVYDDLPSVRGSRWLGIGRLDMSTSGLLLFTTDGELAHRLMHPSTGVEREYAVRILGNVHPDILQRLEQGVDLEDGPARFESIFDAGGTGANHWYHVVLKEGRNREVRRMWESQGLKVSRLIRVRYGPCDLPRQYRAGQYWELPPEQLDALLAVAGMQAPPRPAPVVERKSRAGGSRSGAGRQPRAATKVTGRSGRPAEEEYVSSRKQLQETPRATRGARTGAKRGRSAGKSSAPAAPAAARPRGKPTAGDRRGRR